MSSVLARRRRNSYVWRPGNCLHENSRLLTFVHLQGNVRHRLQGTWQWFENRIVTSGQWHRAYRLMQPWSQALSLSFASLCCSFSFAVARERPSAFSGSEMFRTKCRLLCARRLKKKHILIYSTWCSPCHTYWFILLLEFSEPAKPSCCTVTIHCLAGPRWVGLPLPPLPGQRKAILMTSSVAYQPFIVFIVWKCLALHCCALEYWNK